MNSSSGSVRQRGARRRRDHRAPVAAAAVLGEADDVLDLRLGATGPQPRPGDDVVAVADREAPLLRAGGPVGAVVLEQVPARARVAAVGRVADRSAGSGRWRPGPRRPRPRPPRRRGRRPAWPRGRCGAGRGGGSRRSRGRRGRRAAARAAGGSSSSRRCGRSWPPSRRSAWPSSSAALRPPASSTAQRTLRS